MRFRFTEEQEKLRLKPQPELEPFFELNYAEFVNKS